MPIEVADYFVRLSRDTLENWQSERWLTQSREGDERKEAKLDAILEAIDPKEGKENFKNARPQIPTLLDRRHATSTSGALGADRGSFR